MTTQATNGMARSLARRALAVLEEARRRALLDGAVGLLGERDGYGNEVGTRPYTDEAIERFTVLHRSDPDDLGIVHHLAIAHHSRAWDWELAWDERAVKEWEEALTYWRRLETSAEFWAGLKGRYVACAGAGSDATWLDQVRASLLEQLLGIHADFISAHAEKGNRERALGHVGLVRRARIPPVARERLLARVFAAMTSTVPDARARRDYAAAMSAVTRFSDLFPEYLAAQRLQVEICGAWLTELSYEGEWPTILRLSQGTRRVAELLVAHPQLEANPLARSALLDLGLRFAFLADQRGGLFLAADKRREPSSVDAGEADAAFALGMEWARLICPLAPSGSLVRLRFAECAKGRALLRNRWVGELWNEGTGELRVLRRIEQHFEEAQRAIAEALGIYPEDERLVSGFRDPIDRNLAEVRRMLAQGGGY